MASNENELEKRIYKRFEQVVVEQLLDVQYGDLLLLAAEAAKIAEEHGEDMYALAKEN